MAQKPVSYTHLDVYKRQALAIADARLTGMELHGKTLGLVGVGSIARRAAEMFRRAFGMSIVGYSPSLTEERAACLGIALSLIHI